MYNRYVPQPDGTYRRSQRQDTARQQNQRRPVTPPAQPPNPHREQICSRDANRPQKPCEAPSPPMLQPEACKQYASGSVVGFLKNLLPKDFDTGDLLIVMILLLMAGDCCDEQNTALLTLVLYLFL